MARPPYRTLRIVLRVFSFLVAFGSLLMIFAGKPLILRIFLRPPEGEVSTLLLFLLKETGGFALMLSLLLWFAARDPVRNVAILDAVIAGLCILSITPFVSLWMTDIRTIYPAYLLWGRSVTGDSGIPILAETARGVLGTGGAFLKNTAKEAGEGPWSGLTLFRFGQA